MKEKENCSGKCETCEFAECEQESTVTLDLDNGEKQECSILTIFPAGGKEYIALLPLNEKGVNETGEVYLYRYMEEDGLPSIDNIDSDEEYEIASDAFDEWLDSMEFDEMVSED